MTSTKTRRVFLAIAATALVFIAVYLVESQDRRRQALCTHVLTSVVPETRSESSASLLARCEVGEGPRAAELAPRSVARRQRG